MNIIFEKLNTHIFCIRYSSCINQWKQTTINWRYRHSMQKISPKRRLKARHRTLPKLAYKHPKLRESSHHSEAVSPWALLWRRLQRPLKLPVALVDSSSILQQWPKTASNHHWAHQIALKAKVLSRPFFSKGSSLSLSNMSMAPKSLWIRLSHWRSSNATTSRSPFLPAPLTFILQKLSRTTWLVKFSKSQLKNQNKKLAMTTLHRLSLRSAMRMSTIRKCRFSTPILWELSMTTRCKWQLRYHNYLDCQQTNKEAQLQRTQPIIPLKINKQIKVFLLGPIFSHHKA